MSCSNRTKSIQEITIDYNWCVWIEHWRKNDRYTSRDTTKWFYNNTRPYITQSVKSYLEMFKWEVLPHPPYSDIAPSDDHLFRSIAHDLAEQYFHSYEDAKKWVDFWIASKDVSLFRRGIQMPPENEKLLKWWKILSIRDTFFTTF